MPPSGARLVATSGAAAVVHPTKGIRASLGKASGRAGEDAYFVAATPGGVLAWGVADGVYAWRDQGVDAGLYAVALMEGAAEAVAAGKTEASFAGGRGCRRRGPFFLFFPPWF